VVAAILEAIAEIQHSGAEVENSGVWQPAVGIVVAGTMAEKSACLGNGIGLQMTSESGLVAG